MIVINTLGRSEFEGSEFDGSEFDGSGETAPIAAPADTMPDVNGDGKISAIDALHVINYISRQELWDSEPARSVSPTASLIAGSKEVLDDDLDVVFEELGSEVKLF